MKILNIDKLCVSDGPGIRLSIYCSGCEAHCRGCHNPESWNFNKGDYFNLDYILAEYAKYDNQYTGITFCGGEPLHPRNVKDFTDLAKTFKERYPNKTIWCYTGYEWDQIKDLEIMHYINVAVVGKFIVEQRDISDANRWRGSRNQRVVDVKSSLLNNRQINVSNIPNNDEFSAIYIHEDKLPEGFMFDINGNLIKK